MSKMEVDLALNSRKFQSGVKDAEGALEDFHDVLEDISRSSEGMDDTKAFDGLKDSAKDAETALDDLKRTGKTALDDTERGAKDTETAVKNATREVKDLTEEFKDAAREADDLGDKGRRAGDDTRDGMRRAQEGVENFREESNETAREVAASFDGSAESIGEGFQEIAANALGGFGPAGTVAGIAAAAGIGLAMAGFDDVNRKNEESQQRTREWGQAFIEAGTTAIDALTRTSMAQDILSDRQDELNTNAENWGVDRATALAAMTGEQWALDAAQRSVNEALEEEAAAMADIPYDETTIAAMNMNSTAQEGQRSLDGIRGELQGGAEDLDTYSQYLNSVADNTAGATREVDEFGDTVVTLPDGKQIYIDAETGRATDNVDAIERQIYGIPDGSSTVHVNASTSSADGALWRWQNQRRTVNVTARMIARNGMPLAV